MGIYDDGILPLREGILDDAWVQLVAPAQPAALAAAALYAASDQAPILGPMHLRSTLMFVKHAFPAKRPGTSCRQAAL